MQITDMVSRKSSGEGCISYEIKPYIDAVYNLFYVAPGIQEFFNKEENSKNFFNNSKTTLDLLTNKNIPGLATDVFYAVKCGKYYKGVSPKLVYLLSQSWSEFKAPNLALTQIDNLLVNALVQKDRLPKDRSIKDVLSAIIGFDFKVLSEVRRKVVTGDIAEFLIGMDDGSFRIAVCNKELISEIDSYDDLLKIKYSQDKGIMFGDIPIRTFGNYIGVTKHDFDLRSLI